MDFEIDEAANSESVEYNRWRGVCPTVISFKTFISWLLTSRASVVSPVSLITARTPGLAGFTSPTLGWPGRLRFTFYFKNRRKVLLGREDHAIIAVADRR